MAPVLAIDELKSAIKLPTYAYSSKGILTFTWASNDAFTSGTSSFLTIAIHTPTLTHRDVTLHFIVAAINPATGNIFSRHEWEMQATGAFTLAGCWYKSVSRYKSTNQAINQFPSVRCETSTLNPRRVSLAAQ